MMNPQPCVFISHSRHDTNIVSYFSKIFANIGLRSLTHEWQNLPPSYAGHIITSVICDPNTVAVFVLLGRNLQNPPASSLQYTHNWVSFEVGVASGVGKPIWVFEEFGSFIRYPVPFVTDFAQYTLEDIRHLQYYSLVFQDRFIFKKNRIIPETLSFKCSYTDCNAIYNCWSIAPSFNCPVCRRRLPIPERPEFPISFPANVV